MINVHYKILRNGIFSNNTCNVGAKSFTRCSPLVIGLGLHLDWPKSLKNSINVSYHILVASLTPVALF